MIALTSSGFAWGLAAEILRIVLPVAVVVGLAVAHRLGRAWPLLVAATVTGAAVGAALWHVVSVVGNGL